jgi:hypothetical protein
MHKFEYFSNLGSIFWWIIKFGKSDLESEQAKEYYPRNILTVIIFGYIIGYFSINYFN